jgi:hypothetical protein
MNIGDRVRYIGTKEQDIYHGLCVGREGIVRQLDPWVGVEFDGEHGIRSVGSLEFGAPVRPVEKGRE